jgi:hypothetical protein
MRRRWLVPLLVAAALPGSAAAYTNPQIPGLQVALRAHGYDPGPIDGVVGPRTAHAVKAFQRRAGIHADGLAGPRTRTRLGRLGRPLFGARTLRRGAFGWDVAVLQYLLVRQGISVPINAYYDAPTLHGVRVMQGRLHLQRDGVVGPHTLGALVRREPVPLAHGVTVAVQHTSHHHHRHRTATGIHVVRAGESRSSIARRYHTTVARLARMNHLDPSHYLLIGTRLRVPRGHHHVATTQRVAYRTQSVASVRALLDHWARHYGVSIHLVRALAWMESGYNNALVSSVGARGIMQLLPSTFRFAETVLIGHRLRHDSNGNVRAGVAYLAHLLHDFHGSRRLALAGWYQGEGAVRKHGLYKVSKTFVKDVLALSKRM